MTIKAIEILMMNCNLFKKMKELAEKQEEAVLDDHMDEFNSLLNHREQIRKEINKNFQRYSLKLKDIHHKKDDQKTMTVSKEISDIIRYIQETDKRIEKLIIERKDVITNDIKNIRTGQNAIKRYGVGSSRITRFLDRSG